MVANFIAVCGWFGWSKAKTPERQSIRNKLGDAPVLEAAVWEVSSDDEGYFALGELLDCDL